MTTSISRFSTVHSKASMPPPSDERPSQPLRSLATWLAALLACAAAIVTVLAYLARYHWAFDLMANFPVQLSIATLISAVALVILGRKKWAVLAALVFMANVWRPAAYYVPATTAPVSGTTYRVVSANVLSSNREHAQFLDFIRTT